MVDGHGLHDAAHRAIVVISSKNNGDHDPFVFFVRYDGSKRLSNRVEMVNNGEVLNEFKLSFNWR